MSGRKWIDGWILSVTKYYRELCWAKNHNPVTLNPIRFSELTIHTHSHTNGAAFGSNADNNNATMSSRCWLPSSFSSNYKMCWTNKSEWWRPHLTTYRICCILAPDVSSTFRRLVKCFELTHWRLWTNLCSRGLKNGFSKSVQFNMMWQDLVCTDLM